MRLPGLQGRSGPCGPPTFLSPRGDDGFPGQAVRRCACVRPNVVRATFPHRSATSCGGKDPGRNRGSLAVHCCPPRPWGVSPRPSRTFDRAERRDCTPDVRDPPDLGAVRSRRAPVLATRRSSRVPLVVMSMIAPPSFPSGSPLPELRARRRAGGPSGWVCRSPSACRPRGFPPPRRFVPPRPRDRLQVAADPGVHHVSPCRETGFPAVHLLPSEAFPPPTAARSGTNPLPRWPASPRALPPRPFPGPRGLAPSSGPLRGRSLPNSRARCSHGLVRISAASRQRTLRRAFFSV
jgi:hypothetical protein